MVDTMQALDARNFSSGRAVIGGPDQKVQAGRLLGGT